MSMGFGTDDGLGAAMTQSAIDDKARDALQRVVALEKRVAELTAIVRDMEAMIWPLGR